MRARRRHTDSNRCCFRANRSTPSASAQIKSTPHTVAPRAHPTGCGIDCGQKQLFAAVPPERDPQPVREFRTFTADLQRLADWLIRCAGKNVALESTGVTSGIRANRSFGLHSPGVPAAASSSGYRAAARSFQSQYVTVDLRIHAYFHEIRLFPYHRGFTSYGHCFTRNEILTYVHTFAPSFKGVVIHGL